MPRRAQSTKHDFRAFYCPILLITFILAPLFLLLLPGCKKSTESSSPTEAGAGNYSRLGPIGLAVESTRLGKIRTRGMMGQDGESDRDVFTIKTRFKLFDTSTPVKQPVLQRDGMMIQIMGNAGSQTER